MSVETSGQRVQNNPEENEGKQQPSQPLDAFASAPFERHVNAADSTYSPLPFLFSHSCHSFLHLDITRLLPHHKLIHSHVAS